MLNRREFVAVAAGAALSLTLGSCGGSSGSGSDDATSDDPTVKSEGVMTYAEYDAAAIDAEVSVETYVQAKQSWWENEGVGMASLYTQDADGGYFLYNCPMDEDTYDTLVPGTKIKVSGYKAEWSGEVEIVDATFEIKEGSYVAEPLDVTELLGTDELASKMNMLVSFFGMTVEDCGDGAAFLYNYDGSGAQGDDLYLTLSKDGKSYTFTVESYLMDATTDTYKAVEALKVGDTVDIEGFMYWYEGPQAHVTSVTVR